MLYTRLGRSDIEISKLILGTWAIGGANWGPYDESQAVSAIDEAIDSGITTIDTAPTYGSGHAEELIGRTIKGRRDRVVIATKCGLDFQNGYARDLTPAFLEQEIENSLKRLGTDYIDLYQPHWPDPDTPVEYTMEALERFQAQGKIRAVGLSNYGAAELSEALAFAPVVSLQPPYSLLERDIEREVQPLCANSGISMIPYGSLGAGMLTGKYAEPPKFRKDDARSFFYRFFDRRYWPGVCALVELLRSIASAHGARPGHVAIAWLLSREAVAATIVGARSAEQVRDNIGGLELGLTPEELSELDRVSAAVYEA
ncbi:MAG TPA: aldo/keto reductase [Spirochaetota bacterium]|nr:aldo/keto reductase [Spirochaetota bacterium]HNU91760.1 aldo/keto reductase [Spirochaetota bacterium]